jgi:hypothetical protein
MKHTIEGFIIYEHYSWEEKPTYTFSDSSSAPCTAQCNRALVMEHSFEVDVPDDFDPRPGFVEQLKQEKEKLRAEFSKRVMELDERINSLLALEA